MTLFYVCDEVAGEDIPLPTLIEAMAAAEACIKEYRTEAIYDGEWPDVEIGIFECEAETEEPEEDGTLVAQSVRVPVDGPEGEDDDADYCDFQMQEVKA